MPENQSPHWAELSDYAVRHGMTTDATFLARIGTHALLEARRKSKNAPGDETVAHWDMGHDVEPDIALPEEPAAAEPPPPAADAADLVDVGPAGDTAPLMAEAARRVVGDLTLSVFTLNPDARRLYERLGFRIEGVKTVPFAGSSAEVWIMRKPRPGK